MAVSSLLNCWVVVPANNAEEAIAAGKKELFLLGQEILTVRVATKDEKESMDEMKKLRAKFSTRKEQ